MVRLWICLLLVCLESVGTAVAATESDRLGSLSLGSTPDEILRVAGRPQGRGSTGDRIIWTYPTHRLVFEEGMLVAVNRVDEAAVVRHAANAPVAEPVARPPAPRIVAEPAPPPAAPAAEAEPAPSPARRPVLPVVLNGFLALALLVAALEMARRFRRQRPIAVAPLAEAFSVTGEPLSTETEAAPPAPPVLRRPAALTLEVLEQLPHAHLEQLTVGYLSASGWRPQLRSDHPDRLTELHLVRADDPQQRAYVVCRTGTTAVDARPVRELFGAMVAHGVAEGWTVAPAEFTPAAREFAAAHSGLHLLSGPQLVEAFQSLTPSEQQRILQQVFPAAPVSPDSV